jgi:hypothetical protein
MKHFPVLIALACAALSSAMALAQDAITLKSVNAALPDSDIEFPGGAGSRRR